MWIGQFSGKRWLSTFLFPAVLVGSIAGAGLAPENVAVLVNADSWMSHSVANAYVSLRRIPPGNVISLPGIPTSDSMRIGEFRKKILRPFLAELGRRGIASQIDAVVYSSDFPYAIDFREDFSGRKAPRFVGTRAAITGLTFLYQSVLAADLDYADRGANWYCRRVARESADVAWEPSDREDYGVVERFFAERMKRKKGLKEATDEEKDAFKVWEREGWTKAEETMGRLGGLHPDAPHVQYNLACAQSMCGKLDDAVRSLRQAFSAGYRDWHHMGKDSDLVALRGREDFKELTVEMRDAPVTMRAPRAFSARVGWTPRGHPVPNYKGARYLISTMLGYTSGRGNSYREVVSCLERAAAADGTGPEGTVYFMLNGNVRSTTREWAVRTAAEQIRGLGVQAEVTQGVLPKETTVAGAFVGTASFNWASSKSTIVPGAICEHLTSCGGILRERASQTPLTAFIRAGAAGASGTVVEPFAIQAKFPHAFLQTYYTMGYTLGEAFYLSVASPYQLLIVGDPLCRPWSRPQEVALEGLPEGGIVRAPVKVAAGTAEGQAKRVEFFIDGRLVESLAPGKSFELDPAGLKAGEHCLSAVVVGADQLESRARASRVFEVVNGTGKSACTVTVPASSIIGEDVMVTWTIPAAARVAVWHHGVRLVDVVAEQGELSLPSARLGLGTTRLAVVATDSDGAHVASLRKTVTVAEAPPLTQLGCSWDALAKGIQMEADGPEVKAVEALSGGWLAKAGLREGDTVTVDVFVQAAKEDVYQVQFFGNTPLVDGICRVDGQVFRIWEAGAWRGVPVSLQPGTHSISFSARVPGGKPSLRVCFGSRGTSVLSSKNCRQSKAQGVGRAE